MKEKKAAFWKGTVLYGLTANPSLRLNEKQTHSSPEKTYKSPVCDRNEARSTVS
jgi:hypothetical protein